MKRVSLLFGFWLCFLIAAQPAVASNPAIVGEIDQNVFTLTEHLGKHLQFQRVNGAKIVIAREISQMGALWIGYLTELLTFRNSFVRAGREVWGSCAAPAALRALLLLALVVAASSSCERELQPENPNKDPCKALGRDQRLGWCSLRFFQV
jgi:hypothetical protein